MIVKLTARSTRDHITVYIFWYLFWKITSQLFTTHVKWDNLPFFMCTVGLGGSLCVYPHMYVHVYMYVHVCVCAFVFSLKHSLLNGSTYFIGFVFNVID